MRPLANTTGALALLLLAACGADRYQERFAGERAMWRADLELAKVLARAPAQREEELNGFLEDYRELGDAMVALAAAEDADPIVRFDATELAARAHFREAQVAVALVDSFRLQEVYDRMIDRFAEVEAVHAQVRLAMARIERDRGRPLLALRHLERACRADGAPIERECCLEIAEIHSELTDWDGALRELDQLRAAWSEATRSSPLLRRVELRRIECMLRRGDDPDSVLVVARGFQQRHLGSDSARRGLLIVAEHLVDADPSLAMELADSVLVGVRDPEDVASAMLLRGKLFERRDDWARALQVLRQLIAEYPITEAAMRAHAVIAAHFQRMGQVPDERQAIERGIATLTNMLRSYPSGAHLDGLRSALLDMMRMAGRDREVLDLMLALAHDERGSAHELRWLIAAGRHCDATLHSPSRAAEIYSRAAASFPRTELGRWAAARAAALSADEELD